MPHPPADADLIRVYRETIESLYGYVSRRCGGGRDLVEDVTQEAWLRALRVWPVKGIPTTPLAWLTTVARNLIMDHFRRREHPSLDLVTASQVLAAVDEDEVTDSVEIASAVTN